MFFSRFRKRLRRRHPLLRALRLVFYATAIAGATAAGAALGALLAYIEEQPAIRTLEYYDPQQVTRVFGRHGCNVIAEFYDEKREVLKLNDMRPELPLAFIAIEDERFRQHFGVDPKGILRALLVNARAGGIRQGGSTITQQLTRNILPVSIGNEPTLTRKIKEALSAFVIENRYSKDQIIEFYLNHIFLGYNSYGVQSAAHTYFGKDARALTIAECAALAAIPKAPTRLNPKRDPEKLKKRRDLVLQTMARLDYITEDTARLEIGRPLATRDDERPRVTAPYFVDQVQRDLLRDPDLEEDLLNRGGYQVYSTIEPLYQRILEQEMTRGLPGAEQMWQEGKPARYQYERRQIEKQYNTLAPLAGQARLARIVALRENGVEVELEGYRGFAEFPPDRTAPKDQPAWHKPYFEPARVLQPGQLIDVKIEAVDSKKGRLQISMVDRTHIQGAAVLLDVQTGQVLAMVGGADFYDRRNNGMWNRATRGGRQPGSAFKPLLYAIALNQGKYTPGSVIMDDRIEFPNGYIPRNYENRYFGPTTLYEALAHSNNIVTVKLFQRIGFRNALRGYRLFEIAEPQPTWNLRAEIPLCLGSLNVTPLSLAAAYLPFARQGIIVEPVCVTRVCALDNQIIKLMQPRERRVLSPQTAYLVTAMLMAVVREGTGLREIGEYFPPARNPQIAGKTGTTSDCVDAWFAGYTPELLLVVYVGFDQVRSMGLQMTGSRVAGPIWRGIMQRILATRDRWKMEFDIPPGIQFHDISSRTGLLASPNGPNGDERTLPHVPFAEGAAPTQISGGYHGFPYWNYQHPDPDRNQIADPASLPPTVALAQPAETAPEAEPVYSDPAERIAVPPPSAQNQARVNENLLAPPW